MSTTKSIVLQLGDDIRWNHELYARFRDRFDIRRSYSMNRAEFKAALKEKEFGDFFAIYRPFWNTGGEMGRWDDELISLLPSSCQIYASAGAGFDWVDTECLARKGVFYCNSASACTESVADCALWHILSTFRLFTWSAAAARSGDPEQFAEASRDIAAVSRNSTGHRLGIIGFGRIGQLAAAKAHAALGMEILYNDVVRMPESIEKLTTAQYYADMGALLADADCVLLATPFNGKLLFDRAAFARMKKGARFINIARGKLVDEAALVEALDNAHVSAAGLDVHSDEPHVHKQLLGRRNVELTAHTAGASLDSHIGFERLGMQNILQFHATGVAISPVNRPVARL